ncbi:helix-turn-helix domain-containing protein [Dokdonella soli]|uniref:HTH cro/C1-type domain-containing protein n=1 Tax=Dokdonella soli TaxID=529810 RepID=A0ABN1ICM3_9GAMM
MPNIGTLLKEEISRLCRREIRKHVEPLRKASATYRREIAALKRQVAGVERRTTVLSKQSAKMSNEADASSAERPLRFVAKGLVSLRARLGLSAPELARLMGVSDQSIYNWEHKKTVPRKEQLATLATLRGLGKREVRARLEALDVQSVRKRRKRASSR